LIGTIIYALVLPVLLAARHAEGRDADPPGGYLREFALRSPWCVMVDVVANVALVVPSYHRPPVSRPPVMSPASRCG